MNTALSPCWFEGGIIYEERSSSKLKNSTHFCLELLWNILSGSFNLKNLTVTQYICVYILVHDYLIMEKWQFRQAEQALNLPRLIIQH